jgi:hypothetical protein
VFRSLPRFIKECHIKGRTIVNSVFSIYNFVDSIQIALILVVYGNDVMKPVVDRFVSVKRVFNH